MTLTEFKKGLTDTLKTKYPTTSYAYYGVDTVEGYKRPSFFIQVKPVSMETLNYNSVDNTMGVYITYFQTKADEADALTVVDTMRNLFCLGFKVGTRYVDVSSFDYDFVGTDRNILEISFTANWQDKIVHTETADLMESVIVDEELQD